MVGPFIFFDHMGPMSLAAGAGIDVRPHPHIALATVTYLFSGSIVHRDSLGTVQTINPGDVNWMTAGSGIAHSERSPAEERQRGVTAHGIQSWVALPDGQEEVAPDFQHHPASSLPRASARASELRVIAGEAFGRRSPVRCSGRRCMSICIVQGPAPGRDRRRLHRAGPVCGRRRDRGRPARAAARASS